MGRVGKYSTKRNSKIFPEVESSQFVSVDPVRRPPPSSRAIHISSVSLLLHLRTSGCLSHSFIHSYPTPAPSDPLSSPHLAPLSLGVLVIIHPFIQPNQA